MKYICVDCGDRFLDEDSIPSDGLCHCGCSIDRLVVCKWCGNDVALCNTQRGICLDCWEEDRENIEKELT